MEKLGSYAGNILEVDLSTRSITRMPLPQELVTKFLGGAGLNAWLAYKYIEPHTPPFSPQNALVFGVGPLVGTLAPGAGKSNITSISPVNNYMGISGSGHLGMMKFTGHDHLVITGKSDRPVYLKIGDEVEIREAGYLWGKDTWETTDAIWDELGRKYTVLSIGPAGENLVRDASVIANKYSAYARTGMGAVMGSKNLKAIAAYGTQGITVAHPERFIKLSNQLTREIMSDPFTAEFRRHGSLVGVEVMVKRGFLAYKNFREIAGEELLQAFDLEKFDQGTQHGHVSCLSCPIGCKHSLRWKEGEYGGLSLTLSCALAPIMSFVNCGVLSWPEMLKCCEMCNRLGLDHYSVSDLVALAIELYHRGVINKVDTRGSALDWGSETVYELLKAIAYRNDLGDILADSLIEAPRRIGRGAEDYAIHFKGLGMVGEIRGSMSTTVFGQLTNVTGHATHTEGPYFGIDKEKLRKHCSRWGMSQEDMDRILVGPEGFNLGRLTRWVEDYYFVLECLGICYYRPYTKLDINGLAGLYSAATGVDLDATELLKAAARGRDVRKAFNIREGAKRENDTMPKRLLTEPTQVGDTIRPPFNSDYVDILITDYYHERGWDPQTGTLSPERIAELGLSWEEIRVR
ncbi:aldehyde ferredoxin oxidoreductase family protein [Chloroflexota bacterium]